MNMTHIYCGSFKVLFNKGLPMVFMSGCSSFPQCLLALSFPVLWPAGPQRAKSTVFKWGFPCSLAGAIVLYHHVLLILLDFKTVPRLRKKLKVQPQDPGVAILHVSTRTGITLCKTAHPTAQDCPMAFSSAMMLFSRLLLGAETDQGA